MIRNLIAGVEATVLALLQGCFLAAIGLPLARPIASRTLKLVVAFTLGAALNSALIACLAALVSTNAALLASLVAGCAGVAANRAELWSSVSATIQEARAAIRERPLARYIVPSLAFLYLLNAFAPPRDGDVMRYHLAHIRQIIRDGRWLPIADYHYALPFGWTLNYMAFERLGVPVAANVLDTVVVFMMIFVVARALPFLHSKRSAAAAALLFVLHPAVLKSGTTAFADGYAMLAILIATLLLLDSNRPDANGPAIFLCGLVAWIGIQSRYQLIGFGLAASLSFLVSLRGRKEWKTQLGFVAAGALTAVLLASPFYLMNWRSFGNPIWPFLTHSSYNSSYADIVGALYHRSQTGSHDIANYLWGLKRLVTYRDVFPVPIITALVIYCGWRYKRSDVRQALIVLTSFAGLWLFLQPRLYPRFILYFIPLIIVVSVPLLDRVSSRYRRAFKPAVLYTALMLFAADVAYSADSARYFVTADTSTYHRYTWYYPVYEWANAHTAEDSRFLVIVWSGYSYYLDRRYRRADPWLSGEVDWRRIDDAQSLDSVLTSNNIDYIIYDDRNWSGFMGGQQMMKAIRDAIDKGRLRPVRKFREKLYTSRLANVFNESDVLVLERVKVAEAH